MVGKLYELFSLRELKAGKNEVVLTHGAGSTGCLSLPFMDRKRLSVILSVTVTSLLLITPIYLEGDSQE